jgi:hypothetical protein
LSGFAFCGKAFFIKRAYLKAVALSATRHAILAGKMPTAFIIEAGQNTLILKDADF